MGAYKGLERSDIYLTDHVAKKKWVVSSTDFKTEGIEIIRATSGSYPYYPDPENDSISISRICPDKYLISGSTFVTTSGGLPIPVTSSINYYPRLAFASLKQSFYSGSLTDILNQDPFSTGSSFSGSLADTELQSTITVFGSRDLSAISENSSPVYVISIPKSCFGTYIPEGSIKLTCPGVGDVIDREGALIQNNIVIGDVIYTKGLLIFRGPKWPPYLLNSTNVFTLSFSSAVPVYTYNVNCRVRDLEYNYTYNPTLPSSSLEGKPYTPYVTSIGLYNNVHELLAVAKLSKPIKKVDNVDMTFKIQLDIS